MNSAKIKRQALNQTNCKLSSFVKQLSITLNDNEMQIQLRISDLWGKNYKLEFINNMLIVSALCNVKRVANNNRREENNFSLTTSSFQLPNKIKEDTISHELINGTIYIKANYIKENQFFSSYNGQKTSDYLNNKLLARVS